MHAQHTWSVVIHIHMICSMYVRRSIGVELLALTREVFRPSRIPRTRSWPARFPRPGTNMCIDEHGPPGLRWRALWKSHFWTWDSMWTRTWDHSLANRTNGQGRVGNPKSRVAQRSTMIERSFTAVNTYDSNPEVVLKWFYTEQSGWILVCLRQSLCACHLWQESLASCGWETDSITYLRESVAKPVKAWLRRCFWLSKKLVSIAMLLKKTCSKEDWAFYRQVEQSEIETCWADREREWWLCEINQLLVRLCLIMIHATLVETIFFKKRETCARAQKRRDHWLELWQRFVVGEHESLIKTWNKFHWTLHDFHRTGLSLSYPLV